MTLYLKSDQYSTNSIFDISGNAVIDYVLSADFDKKVYSLGGEAVEFADIVNYKRDLPHYDVLNGDFIEIPADTPEFGDPRRSDGRGGFWMSMRGYGSRLGDGQLNTSRAVNLASYNGQNMTLQVWGGGYVKISGDIELTRGGGDTAREGVPVTFKPVNNGNSANVSFEVGGDVVHYQASTQYAWYQGKPAPALLRMPTATLQPAVLSKINSNNTGITIAVRTEITNFDVRPTYPESLFEITGSNTKMSLFINNLGSQSIRIKSGAKSEYYAKPDVSISESELTTLFVCDTLGISVYRGGVLLLRTSDSLGDLSAFHFCDAPGFVGIEDNSAPVLFKNLVVYPYALTADKAAQVSAGFKW